MGLSGPVDYACMTRMTHNIGALPKHLPRCEHVIEPA
jgi:hypothetical protein